MGAYGLGNALGGAYVHGREGDWKGATPHLAEVLLSMAPIPGMKRGALRPNRIENPIRAYHGSPHDFDKFDLSKIGTGEGAQAFGHGIYLAENEGVARSYRDNLAGQKVNEPYPWPSPQVDKFDQYDSRHLAATYLKDSGGSIRDALRSLQNDALTSKGVDSKFYYAARVAQRLLKEIPDGNLQPSGHMYEVNIHATPDQFLDWDKPLSQQSEAVRGAVRSLLGRDPYPRERWTDVEPSVLSKLADRVPVRDGSQSLIKQAEEMLPGEFARHGVVGRRYLDQGSRGSGEGTSNYVVSDPNMIEILRKYGIAGPVAGLTTADILAKYGRKEDDQ